MKILFNTLKLSEDRRALNIDISLVNETGEDYELKSIHIDDNLTYEGNWNGEPSERPLFSQLISGTTYTATLTKAELLRARTSQKSPKVKTATGSNLNSLSYKEPDTNYTGYPEVTDPKDIIQCRKFDKELAMLRNTDCITPNRCCTAQYGTTFDNSFLLVYVEYESNTRGASGLKWYAEFEDSRTQNPANVGEVVLSPFPEIEFNAGDEKIVDVLYYSNIQSESGDIYWEATFTDDYTAEGENVGNIVLDPTTVVLDYASDDKPVTVTIGSDGKIYDGKVSGYVIGITLDWSGYYHSSIGYMKALGSSPCRPPLEFINHILMGKAIEYSVLCGDYSEAIELWNTLFINGVQPNTGGCGCRT